MHILKLKYSDQDKFMPVCIMYIILPHGLVSETEN